MLKQVIEIVDYLDSATIDGEQVVDLFAEFKNVEAITKRITGDEGHTDFVKVTIFGTAGKSAQGQARTLGIVGRLGGIGARPSRVGMVSDADGALSALATALKLAEMAQRGDRLKGDVIVTTHICPNAPTEPHEPVDFMGSPVDMDAMNDYEVLPEMDGVVSVDATKGNNVINHKGIALSPTVKEGYILRVPESFLRIMTMTTGKLPVTFPITTQDITPYGNDIYHINSILQPATATNAPVIGLAVTAEAAVPGCGTGANHEVDLAEAGRFMLEVAKEFTEGTCDFYEPTEFTELLKRYGKLNHLQTLGK